eukprot:GILK01010497.1.p1 GENE.GILK01010497.1~~GILK01010497.1.p1  ORF type:complete len:729 (+),score=131.87 GILK01010497.1:419-2605(+)
MLTIRYSLTLIDSLDSLLVFGQEAEFRERVKWIIENVSFDRNVTISVFEANIRVLGGLLSAHVLIAEGDLIPNYKGELLTLAWELGNRFLPAFETPTGLPYTRVNLRHGVPVNVKNDTSPAEAGTLILEFGVLSRLTGDERFENVAKRALKVLWRRRSGLSLFGASINVQNGQWTNRHAGIGAGFDSYFEYLMKAYILFGDPEYLEMFKIIYASVQQFVKKGPFYVEVEMSNGLIYHPYVGALSAFWPAVQVLSGDVEAAIRSYVTFYEIWKRFQALPDTFDVQRMDLGPFGRDSPLRPELVESTFFLYRATKDVHYLNIGRQLLQSLKMSRTECGFASIADVSTKRLDDRMDSFFLSETLKYLYLLFSDDKSLKVPLGSGTLDYTNVVFTTEGHMFPLLPIFRRSQPSLRNSKTVPSCHRSSKTVWTVWSAMSSINNESSPQPSDQCVSGSSVNQVDPFHIQSELHKMALHAGNQQQTCPSKGSADIQGFIRVISPTNLQQTIPVSLAAFGPRLPSFKSFDWKNSDFSIISGEVIPADPHDACLPLVNNVAGKIVLAQRGNCMFAAKARMAEAGGAVALIIVNRIKQSNGPVTARIVYGVESLSMAESTVESIVDEPPSETSHADVYLMPTDSSGPSTITIANEQGDQFIFELATRDNQPIILRAGDRVEFNHLEMQYAISSQLLFTMADDGTGAKVNIPSVMIGQAHSHILLGTNENPVQVELWSE